MPAFWPPLRPDEPPPPTNGDCGSGTLEVVGGELGVVVGEVGGLGVGVGVGDGGEDGGVIGPCEGELGDGVGTNWASNFVNNKISTKRFKDPFLVTLSIMFVKPNTMCQSWFNFEGT